MYPSSDRQRFLVSMCTARHKKPRGVGMTHCNDFNRFASLFLDRPLPSVPPTPSLLLFRCASSTFCPPPFHHHCFSSRTSLTFRANIGVPPARVGCFNTEFQFRLELVYTVITGDVGLKGFLERSFLPFGCASTAGRAAVQIANCSYFA